mmetsp:Transcript_61411/g.159456  ORF Transcript_61411/g.159456 Transcript_61411/m.159456 type:complete len:226 (-) Transcript_61411:9-686(-)
MSLSPSTAGGIIHGISTAGPSGSAASPRACRPVSAAPSKSTSGCVSKAGRSAPRSSAPPTGGAGRPSPRRAASISSSLTAPKASSPLGGPRASCLERGARRVMSSSRAMCFFPLTMTRSRWTCIPSASTSGTRASCSPAAAPSRPSPAAPARPPPTASGAPFPAVRALKAITSFVRSSEASSSNSWHFLAKILHRPRRRWPVFRRESNDCLSVKLRASSRRSASE